jgi:hypothetical protein
MRDFKQQMERYGDEMKSARCPLSDAELDREIRSVVWNTQTDDNQTVIPRRRSHWLWPSVAAAACLSVLVPLSLPARGAEGIARVNVNGEHLYFVCNNGCSAEGTLETFKTMIR